MNTHMDRWKGRSIIRQTGKHSHCGCHSPCFSATTKRLYTKEAVERQPPTWVCPVLLFWGASLYSLISPTLFSNRPPPSMDNARSHAVAPRLPECLFFHTSPTAATRRPRSFLSMRYLAIRWHSHLPRNPQPPPPKQLRNNPTILLFHRYTRVHWCKLSSTKLMRSNTDLNPQCSLSSSCAPPRHSSHSSHPHPSCWCRFSPHLASQHPILKITPTSTQRKESHPMTC